MSNPPELPDASLVAQQLSRALGAIEWAHSPDCGPGSDQSICETCRVAYPCPTIAAMWLADRQPPASTGTGDGCDDGS